MTDFQSVTWTMTGVKIKPVTSSTVVHKLYDCVIASLVFSMILNLEKTLEYKNK